MSISQIDYNQVPEEQNFKPKVTSAGIYQMQIESAISKPNKAGNGTNLAIYFSILAPSNAVHESYASYYAYIHPIASVANRAAQEIKKLLIVLGVPLGSSEEALIGRKCHVELVLDQKGNLQIARIQPIRTLTQPTINLSQPKVSAYSIVDSRVENPFDGFDSSTPF